MERTEGGNEVSSQLLARVAGELRLIMQETGWTRTLAIGKLVLCSFFKGDVRAWQDRHRSKDTSIRRLAEQPHCPLAKTALTEAVGVYVICRELVWVRQFDQITPSHVAAVLGLSELDQIDLLRSVVEQGASVRCLKRKALELRRGGGKRQGRPSSPPARKALTQLQAMVRGLRDVDAELRTARDLDETTRSNLHGALRDLSAAVGILTEAVDAQSIAALLPVQARPVSTIAPRLPSDPQQRTG